MLRRALTAFLVLPGILAILVPALAFIVDPWRKTVWLPGLAVMAAGMLLLLWCVRDFYVAGNGTLAPWSPPKRLVQTGCYRFCRNPMYLGVLTLVGGWALFAASPVLACYEVLLALGFHFRVVWYEEPNLAGLFGDEWTSYAAHVPRWLPRSPGLKKEADGNE